MADRLVVMSEGRVRQVGSQQDLYERPADRFVAGFVGRSTFLDGSVTEPGRFVTSGGLAIACSGGMPGQASLALRPERLALASGAGQGHANVFPGVVEFASYLGASIDLHVRLSPQDRVIVQLPSSVDGMAAKAGDNVHVTWPATTGALFPGTSDGAAAQNQQAKGAL